MVELRAVLVALASSADRLSPDPHDALWRRSRGVGWYCFPDTPGVFQLNFPNLIINNGS